MPHRRKRFAAGGLAALMSACGGTPAAPEATPAPNVPGGPTVTISGTVLNTQTGAPVPFAFLNVGSNHFETDASGRFTISMPPSVTPAATAVGVPQSRVNAGQSPPYITHTVALDLSRSRENVRLDIIEDSPPFSSVLYRELARDGRDTPPGNRFLRPWTIAPSFYIRTTHVETGQPVPPIIITELETMFRHSVPELTGGHFSVAAIESGPDARPDRSGWVNVLFQSVLPTPGAGGQATVGGNSGTMWLRFDPSDPQLNYGGLSCSYATGAAEHEIMHSLGFWHVSPIPGVNKPFQSPDFCTGRNRPEIIRYHAAIMYARPVNNSYIDVDPISFLSATALVSRRETVACSLELGGR